MYICIANVHHFKRQAGQEVYILAWIVIYCRAKQEWQWRIILFTIAK